MSAKDKYIYQPLTNPDRIEVQDDQGNWVATFTKEAHTVTLKGPPRTFSEGAISVKHDT
jgi:hypothetical protein